LVIAITVAGVAAIVDGVRQPGVRDEIEPGRGFVGLLRHYPDFRRELIVGARAARSAVIHVDGRCRLRQLTFYRRPRFVERKELD